jgi:hypothetical protein
MGRAPRGSAQAGGLDATRSTGTHLRSVAAVADVQPQPSTGSSATSRATSDE